MHVRIRLGLLVAVAALGTTVAVAQNRAATPFRSGIDLVSLEVCVTDRDGRFVSGLNAEDFIVFDDRVPQRVTLFSTEGNVPLAAVVLIDRSNSMAGAKLERAKSAAVTFLDRLRTEDQAEVMAFSRTSERIVPFGLAGVAAHTLVGNIVADGQTALFDAVLVALRELKAAPRSDEAAHRNALVVLSDGEDTASRLAFEDVLEEVRRAGVLVYGISLRTDEHDRVLPPLRELAQLSTDTGGRAVAVRDLGVLESVYTDIAAELRHMYRLAYVPATPKRDGRWHAISVRTVARDLRMRTRLGYYAARPSPVPGGLP